jgi:hypothetical protein
MAPHFYGTGTGLLSLKSGGLVQRDEEWVRSVWLPGKQEPVQRHWGNSRSDLEAGRTLSFAVKDPPTFCDRGCAFNHIHGLHFILQDLELGYQNRTIRWLLHMRSCTNRTTGV